MRKILSIIFICFLIFSCGVKKTTVEYNHITGETKTVKIIQEYDDEFIITLDKGKIISGKPINFEFEYSFDVENGVGYFYSPYMSEYMQNKDYIIFEISYEKDTKSRVYRSQKRN